MKLQFVLPELKHEKDVWSYRQAFVDKQQCIDGGAGLVDADNYKEWLNCNKLNRSIKTVQSGFVPAMTFLVYETSEINKLVGMVDIRRELNDYLFKYGGNIGYSVGHKFRNMGIATEILKIAIEWCSINQMSKILITCHKDNAASKKVIEKNGGVLDNSLVGDIENISRYWILL